VLILRSPRLLARLDPEHGAELLDLVDLTTGRQLLGRLPFASADRAHGPLDELDWIAGWRGGWQVCAPNPGNRCGVDGVDHGFHGGASHERWAILDATASAATLRWSGQGLELTRAVGLVDDRIEIEMRVSADSPTRVPYALLEHVSLGLELLDPVLDITLPPAATVEVSDVDGPVRAPANAPAWPHALLLDGTTERVDRVELHGAPTGRFLCVHDLREGRAVARGRAATLELTWDVRVLPHVWVWYELRASDGPFRRMAEIVALEPSSVPHSLGLARAVTEGQAGWLGPGEHVRYRFGARVGR
jgi:hypothetical protein